MNATVFFSSPALHSRLAAIRRVRSCVFRAVHSHQYSTTDQSTNDLHGRVLLVQGASRGLGLEFVSQALGQPGTRVVATCRRPANAQDLQNLQSQHGDRLLVVKLDVTDEESIMAAAEVVKQAHPGVDVLINAAAVLHDPSGLSPERSLAQLTSDSMLLSFKTNAIGPALVCKAFAPLLVNAAKAGSTSQKPSVIANISARVGSIGDNRLGGWYSYRSSKAALNMLTRTMSLEFERKRQNVSCLMLHPGTCDTDLSKPFQQNVPPSKLFSRERGVQQLLKIISGASMADNGKYLAWDGQEIPW